MVTALHLYSIFNSDFPTIISLASLSTLVGFDKANDETIFIREESQTHTHFRNENITNELPYLRKEILGTETVPAGGRREDIKFGKLQKPERLRKHMKCRRLRRPIA